MNIGLGSLRGRIILLSVFLLLTLFTAAFHIHRSAATALDRTSDLSDRHRHIGLFLASLKVSLHDVESGLYQYAVLKNASQRAKVKTACDSAIEDLLGLQELVKHQRDPQLRVLIARLVRSLDVLHADVERLLTLLDNDGIRYPISVLEQQKLRPTNIRFISAVENALAEIRSGTDTKTRELLAEKLQNIRYYWVRHVSAVRKYIMSRSEMFGHALSVLPELENRRIYLKIVDEGLKETQNHPQVKLDVVLGAEIAVMIAARHEFEGFFQEAVALYESDRWRADVPFFRDRIKPEFADMWAGMNAVDARIAASAS